MDIETQHTTVPHPHIPLHQFRLESVAIKDSYLYVIIYISSILGFKF